MSHVKDASVPTGDSIFPLSRVKKTIKADESIDTVSAEAVFMVSKATEYFINQLTLACSVQTRIRSQKTVSMADVLKAVRAPEYEFLWPLFLPNLVKPVEGQGRQEAQAEGVGNSGEPNQGVEGVSVPDLDVIQETHVSDQMVGEETVEAQPAIPQSAMLDIEDLPM